MRAAVLFAYVYVLAVTTVQSFVPPSIVIRPPTTCLASTPSNVRIIFSDIDGSLIHYPEKNDKHDKDEIALRSDVNNTILALPASATGMRGVISSQTLAYCSALRSKGIKLVLVSGMRTSTLLGRLPFLPKADAYCTEAGGRIFYPTKPLSEHVDGPFPFQQATPVEFSGANQDTDLKPFGLREDAKWRKQMERTEAAGKDGYAGNEVSSNRCDALDDDDMDEECLIDYDNQYGFPKPQEVIPVSERDGNLWNFARTLQQEHGLVLDTTSYSTCFRVNKKHQTGSKGQEKFQALLQGDISLPPELDTSTNLGCIDVYHVSSGKRNCCKFIAQELGFDLATESACICDDDNDIEMALACAHTYIPALTSDSMVETMRRHPSTFTQTFQQDVITSTLATEAALQLIYDGVVSASPVDK